MLGSKLCTWARMAGAYDADRPGGEGPDARLGIPPRGDRRRRAGSRRRRAPSAPARGNGDEIWSLASDAPAPPTRSGRAARHRRGHHRGGARPARPSGPAARGADDPDRGRIASEDPDADRPRRGPAACTGCDRRRKARRPTSMWTSVPCAERGSCSSSASGLRPTWPCRCRTTTGRGRSFAARPSGDGVRAASPLTRSPRGERAGATSGATWPPGPAGSRRGRRGRRRPPR